MADVYTIKQGDTSPPLRAQLLEGDGPDAIPIVLPFGSTVVFNMRPADKTGPGVELTREAAFITDGAIGKVEYRWVSGDTAVAGIYRGEFEIAFPDLTKQTVPSDQYIDVEIIADLG